jgi:hypothetical protein
MRKAIGAVMVMCAAAAYAAAPGVVSPGTQSTFNVTSGGKTLGMMTLLTSTSAARAEWKPSSGGKAVATTVYIADGKTVWLRATGGDVDLATFSNNFFQHVAAEALLASGRPASATIRGMKVTYTYDSKGATRIEIGATTLTRMTMATSNADASNFVVRPKSSSGSRLAALTGSLLGPSDKSVSATAGTRGAGQKGLKLADGGDYGAVEKLENRDANWRAKLDDALAAFQREGKVGKSRENQ